MTSYASSSDRRQESDSVESRAVYLDIPGANLPIAGPEKCQVCGATERRHTGDGWELHQEELRRRARHFEGRLRLEDTVRRAFA